MANRIAVVSPFVDKRHGTERCVAEQIERLARNFGYEIVLYSQRVKDVGLGGPQGNGGGSVVWRRVSELSGAPHLIRYLWWFLANHLCRWRDRGRGLRCDLVYSPGINCLDAGIVSVHVVFAGLYRQVRGALRFRRNPVRTWPRIAHRLLYYRLVIALERLVYPGRARLTAISRKSRGDLASLYGCDPAAIGVVYHGIDLGRFSPLIRTSCRSKARAEAGVPGDAFALLLIGNDWKTKGLACLIEAASELVRAGGSAERLRVLVAGHDDPAPFETLVRRLGDRVRFLPPRPDVEVWYAAADAYVGPSLEDAFALPPAEAMACGLPVIVSGEAGSSEIITDGVDGLILKDPRDHHELAGLISRLLEDTGLCSRLGEKAARTAAQYTWDDNAAGMHRAFQDAIACKHKQ